MRYEYLATLVPRCAGIQTATFHAISDGASIELRWYTKTSREGARPASQAGAEPGPAVVYAHGGGMVLGTLDLAAHRRQGAWRRPGQGGGHG